MTNMLLDGASGSMRFECPIHGQFGLDSTCVAIVNTPEFQRLRDLKQLGLTHLVFPSAEHSR